tara:strand:+ start:184 stop:1074 length:891 start_codon:yes stop_codon:yes gene_type:complete
MVKKDENGKAHEYKRIKLSEIYNDLNQVRKKTAQKDIDKIEESIRAIGQQTPIGVCFSEETKNSDKYKYHLIYGQKRMLAIGNLGKKTIEAKIYVEPKIWTKQQILVEALAENYADTGMDKTEVWEIIQEFYFMFNKNLKKIQKETGIRYEDIKEAVKSHEIEVIKGGTEVKDHIVTYGEFTDAWVMDIIEPCLVDLKTVNVKKAKEFNDKLAAVELPKRKNIIKVAKADRNQEVDTWIKDGEAMAVWKGKTISFQDEEIARIENYADTLGLDFSDFVRTAALDAITIAVDETDED